MFDSEEGLDSDGMIRTGARRDRVPAEFEPVLIAVVEALRELSGDALELHLYGSVANGSAQIGVSDVDLMAIGVPDEWAHEVSAALSERFVDLCRGVEIGPAQTADFRGAGDEAYGNRVFLRHYCVPIAGPDALRSREPFPGDVRAARGFNGDIARRLDAWRSGADPKRVARKILLAAAGLISVHERIWSTDRDTAARRWAEVDPDRADDMAQLLRWAQGRWVASSAELAAALRPDGVVAAVVDRFAAEIGLWTD